jgi:sugar lactone lactonase YvrE
MKTLSLPTTLLCLALSGQVFAAKIVPNHAIADLVLGQVDFVTGTPLTPASSFSLNNPRAVAFDPLSQKVFVTDSSNSRVLRYPSMSDLVNGAGAEAVFGKPSFGETGSTSGQQGLSSSLRGLFFDRRGRLWVADAGNNRVVCFEAAAYSASNAFADRVFGQPDFATTTSGTTNAKFDFPESAVVDSEDRLWVADFDNNRVLWFNSITTKASGAIADGVLGQPDFVTSTPGSGAAQMDSPIGIATSFDGALFVGDNNNNRVLRFAGAAALANGAAATGVLGQADFASTTPGTSATKLSQPSGLWCTTTGDLWVMDDSNDRVLRFGNAANIPSGSAASGVVGQPDFTTSGEATTNRGLAFSIAWPLVDSRQDLWVADRNNDRVLRFSPDVIKPLLTVTSKVPKTVTKKNRTIKGTASDQYGISQVQYRLGNGPVKTATGTTTWEFTVSLKKGKNKITIFATDSVGNVSLSKVVKIKRS